MNKMNKKGFTLIEMLVVIAIIAILVSIIIPVVGSSTEKASAATDAANLRAAKAQLTIAVLDGQVEKATSDTPAEITWKDASWGTKPVSKSFNGATFKATVDKIGNVKVTFEVASGDDAGSYGINYFQTIAETGNAPTETQASSN